MQLARREQNSLFRQKVEARKKSQIFSDNRGRGSRYFFRRLILARKVLRCSGIFNNYGRFEIIKDAIYFGSRIIINYSQNTLHLKSITRVTFIILHDKKANQDFQ